MDRQLEVQERMRGVVEPGSPPVQQLLPLAPCSYLCQMS